MLTTTTIIIIIIQYILLVVDAIEFRACCDENCETFADPNEMRGIACCSKSIYNTTLNICCDGVIHTRDRGGVMAHSCCGSNPLRLDQTCCQGKIHNIISGMCCGSQVYLPSDATKLCCRSNLVSKSTPDDVCCGIEAFNPHSEMCCGDRVHAGADNIECCAMANGTMVAYNSDSHVCCDGPLPKINTTKACCYLRRDGVFMNTQYDKRRDCCKYPYDKLYPFSECT
ncbi:unnamed protein product [Caenorhabditis bovis]|uniref:Galaxin-like repeats domain-containing protein n=1 Tax=Caenorhabditis bovis TaxID=2654633 RepID=A0A8S1F467_9PELO|nr:unnamed protein product [Caenorhabditis bovis]